MTLAANERLVIDASVAVKWVVPETGSENAERLLDHRLAAPDLLYAECANILWKKVRRGELSIDEAEIAAQALENADLAPHSTRLYLAAALAIAAALDHPAYDCIYLALAEALSLRFVTADRMLVRKIAGSAFESRVLALNETARDEAE